MKLRPLVLTAISLTLIMTLAACGPAAASVPTSAPIAAAATQPPAAPAATAVPAATAAPAAPTDLPTSAPKPTAGAAAGGCTNAYYPVGAGDTWSYASTGSVIGDYTYSRTLSALSNTGFTVQDVFSTGVTRAVKWNCSGGNLTSLAGGPGNATVSTKTMTMTIDSQDTNGYAIPAAFESGKTWSESVTTQGTMMLNGAKQGSSVGELKTSCSAGASESVTVPAGTFDAVKVTCHIDDTTTVTLNGAGIAPVNVSMDETDWYAKGVGLVKSMNNGDLGNVTETLTKYTIP